MQTLQLKIARLLLRLSIMSYSVAGIFLQAARKITPRAIPEKARKSGNDGIDSGSESV